MDFRLGRSNIEGWEYVHPEPDIQVGDMVEFPYNRDILTGKVVEIPNSDTIRVKVKEYHIMKKTRATFISRPEKPEEHVFKGIQFTEGTDEDVGDIIFPWIGKCNRLQKDKHLKLFLNGKYTMTLTKEE